MAKKTTTKKKPTPKSTKPKIPKPKIFKEYNKRGTLTLEITDFQVPDKPREYKDMRKRPKFSYELLCKMVGKESADFIFRDQDGELIFKQVEDIVVNGQTRENYEWVVFPSMEKLKGHSMYKEEESAKGTIKSFKTHAMTAFINYNFHYLQTSASAQLIKLVNRWLKQFVDDLKIIHDAFGLDLTDWFEVTGYQQDQKLGSMYYLNYPVEHPSYQWNNKHVQLGVLKDPNGWTNITSFFGTKGMFVYHANEEPVRVRTSVKDKSEILDHRLVEVNEGILLNNIYRSARDTGHPYIVHSTFNANTTKNIRVQRNTSLFPHPTDWMLENPRDNHTMVMSFPTEKKGLGISIMRQSKLSSPVLRNPDKNGNRFALEELVARVVNDELEEQEKLTVLGIPFDMPDPNLETTYVNLIPKTIPYDKFIEKINKDYREVHRVDAGIDQDPRKEYCFAISCSVWNYKTDEWEIFRIANLNSEQEIPPENKVLAAMQRSDWVIEQIKNFINFKIKSDVGNTPQVFLDDHMFSLLIALEKTPEVVEAVENGIINTLRAPKINGWHKDDRDPNNKKKKIYYHGSIENRVQFENERHIYKNIYFVSEFTQKLMEDRREIQSSFHDTKNLWLRIEDHNEQPLNRINATEYAESQIREDMSWSKIREKRKRALDSEGNTKYELMR